MPRASMTSAEPQRLDTARLPCLATLRPAPATTKAVVVETLKVEVASPPVPQVSTTVSQSTLISSRSRSMRPFWMGMRVALPRITRAAAVISTTVSPLILQGGDEGADLGLGGPAAHDDLHGPGHLSFGQILLGDHF